MKHGGTAVLAATLVMMLGCAAACDAPQIHRPGGDASFNPGPDMVAPDAGSGGSPVTLPTADPATAEPGGAPAVAADGGVAAAEARASADASPNATGIGCAAAKLCDDFEGYKSGAGLGAWKTSVAGGSLALEGTHVYSGKQSLHVHADPGSLRRAQISRSGAPLFPLTPNVMWGRMMVWATGLPPRSVHVENILADAGTSGKQYGVGYMGGIHLSYQPHDCWYGNGKELPQQKWSCWEWQFDGTSNTIEFYVDGTLQAKVTNMGQGCVDGTKSIWTAPTWGAVHIGWLNYQTMPAAVDMWIDDVAIDGKRIGCTPAKAGEAH